MVKTKREYSDYKAQCETYFDYRIKYNLNGLLSIVFYDYQYAGGAHGNTLQSSYTFDLSNGTILNLSDLMNDTSYLPNIDKFIRTEIDKKVASGDLIEFEESRFVTIGDHPGWYLSNGSVVIYFQQYEYFPYVAGIQEFKLNPLEMKDYLKININK
jgi:inhibitor of cysteine peptidase